jgi:alkaline phosphatase D
MTISRRELLRVLVGAGAATACGADGGSGADGTEDGTEGGTDGGTSPDTSSSSTTGSDGLPTYEYDGEPGPEDLFQHGVASGDPLTDAVILWSRVTGAPEGTVEAFFEVALDPEFTDRVAADYIETTSDRDWTIKLDVTGLAAGTTYYYRFYCLGRTSPIGRTRTAGTDVSRLRLAVMSCSSLAHGYFHAYRAVSLRADLDLVVHLGDYIYEYGTGEYGDVRPYEPATETLTLADYRARYSQYRRDPDLLECHRQHPFVATWDDHEIADDAYDGGAGNHDPATEGAWGDRKAAATQAYFEWMPLREGDEGVVYRSLAFGGLVQLIMLDTRHAGREQQVASAFDEEALADPMRQLLGSGQEAWLATELAKPAQWKLIGQQVMLSQLRLGENPLNLDQWDGYPAARQRLLDMLREHSPTNAVILTGDIHSSWAFEVADDPFSADYDPVTGAGAVAVEFVAPSITSPGFPSDTADVFMETHPHLKWGNLVDHGYVLLDVTPERLQASWWIVADVESPSGGAEAFVQAWAVEDGVVHLVADAAPADPPTDAPLPAP